MACKQAKTEGNKPKADKVRQKATERFGQIKVREGYEEPAKKKRRGGVGDWGTYYVIVKLDHFNKRFALQFRN